MEFIDTMGQRRAINFFDPDKPISDEELKRIIETASLAPSGLNLQPWQVIVVRSQEEKEKLMAAASRQTKIVEAVRKAFNIPENFFIPLLIAIGHFNERSKLMPPKWRKSYDEIVYATF